MEEPTTITEEQRLKSPMVTPGLMTSNTFPDTEENVWKIVFTVCKHFGTWTNDVSYLKCNSRCPELGTPRMVVIVLFHYLLNRSQSKSTEYFGMTPAGFWYSRKKINEWYKYDRSFKAKIDGIFTELAQCERQKEYLYKVVLD
jgi:chromosomal replication initiation ATPase DnaA